MSEVSFQHHCEVGSNTWHARM